MKKTAVEIHDLIDEKLKGLVVNYSYVSGYTASKGTYNEKYLLKDEMLEIAEHLELDENATNFMNQCFDKKVLNICDGEKPGMQEVEMIIMRDINTVCCIAMGKEFVDIMTERQAA